MRLLPLPLCLALFPLLGQEGKIVRPVDQAALLAGEIKVLAKAPGGRVEMDNAAVEAVERFPGIWEAKLKPAPGAHTLRAVWEGGSHEIRIWVGPDAPATYKAFREHPPVAVECEQCHGISRRGRFRFTGGCFSCHAQDQFAKAHQHPPHVFEQCGACHNAHGSTSAKHFVHTRQQVCGLCHTVPVAPAK